MIDALVSIVIVVRDVEETISSIVASLHDTLAGCTTEHEIVLVNNLSGDGTVQVLEKLSTEIPNLQVYCLSNRVDDDIARLAGIEQAIGDYVVLMDVFDETRQIPAMLDLALAGHEIVLAVRTDVKKRYTFSVASILSRLFLRLYRLLSGYDLRKDAPRFRLMSRKVVNYVLQDSNAYLTYQLLPLRGGFTVARLTYSPQEQLPHAMTRSFRDALSYAVALSISTTTAPLRLITLTCCVSGSLSLLYSIYVFFVYLFKEDVIAGWTTLSLQISVQFFLLSFVIGVLAEYMVHMRRQNPNQPRYYILREFRSGQVTREFRLNVSGDTVANKEQREQ